MTEALVVGPRDDPVTTDADGSVDADHHERPRILRSGAVVALLALLLAPTRRRS